MIKTPKATSVYKAQVPHPKGTIQFAPELINFIKQKKKYITYRFGNKYDFLNPGDTVEIRETGKEETVAMARIVRKTHTTFTGLPLNNPGHESSATKEEQRKVFNGYYAYLGREIRDDDEFIILEFELVD